MHAIVLVGIGMREIDRTCLKVYLVEEVTLLHLPLRVAADQLMLQLELNDADRLVHLANQVNTLVVVCHI